MRISDWSSDVCSSDLDAAGGRGQRADGGDPGQWVAATHARGQQSHRTGIRGGSGRQHCSQWPATAQPRAAIPRPQPAAVQGELAERVSPALCAQPGATRSEEHTSELQSLMRISYAVFCLKNKKNKTIS